jgi:hypothetical protein
MLISLGNRLQIKSYSHPFSFLTEQGRHLMRNVNAVAYLPFGPAHMLGPQ